MKHSGTILLNDLPHSSISHLFSLFFVFLIATCGASQTLTGTVYDAQSLLPLGNVGIRLSIGKDTLRTQTDSSGKFSLRTPAGNHTFTAHIVGYKPLRRTVKVEKNKNLRLDSLKMVPLETLLSEATVTALERELTIKADTFVYHADAFRLPPGATIGALVKQLPGLEMDADGNLTYQGKAVSDILVDGKPFFDNQQTAMQNIVAESVKDVEVYEKTDEKKEFTGSVDVNKNIVVDLKIKKEYKNSWNVNADAGYGTHERYLGKVFATSFNDRNRLALFGQINNISENARADENGNWQNWGSFGGVYTYRSAGGIYSFDNGKKATEAGRLRITSNLNFSHNNQSVDKITNRERFVDDTQTQYSYQKEKEWRRFVNASGRFNLQWNADTLNRLAVNVNFDYRNTPSNASIYASVYNENPLLDDPYTALLPDSIAPTLKAKGVYSMQSTAHQRPVNRSWNFFATWTHRFKKEGRNLSLGVASTLQNNDADSRYLTYYRYFSPLSPQPDLLNRQMAQHPKDQKNISVSLDYEEPLSKHWNALFNYTLRYSNQHTDYLLYQLDRYAGYRNLLRNVDAVPATQDSLRNVLNADNSYEQTIYGTGNDFYLGLDGHWDKVELHIGVNENLINEHLSYDRDGNKYRPHRRYSDFQPNFRINWKFKENSQLNFYYSGHKSKTDLADLLPFSDTSNEMNVMVNNPDLKDTWTNYFNTFIRYFNNKRGDSYSASLGFSNQFNTNVSTQKVDAATGKVTTMPVNVNGIYGLHFGLSTEQPLDSARHWTASFGVGGNMYRNKSYIGDADGQLCVINNYSPTFRTNLNWKNAAWRVAAHANYSMEISRYDTRKDYNQTGSTFEAEIAPQVELPFGLRISTSLMYYVRWNYADALLNHNQWLWNATVSQSFLKGKNLSVALECQDILHRRTAEYSTVSPTGRTFSRTKSFLSYCLLHITYRFNTGPKNN